MLMVWEGAGLGARASRAPLAASHPLPTSAHLPRGPATCAGCSRAAGSREELRAEEERVCGGHSSAEAVSPGFIPAGGVICAHSWTGEAGDQGIVLGAGSGWCLGFQEASDGFWSPCWHLALTAHCIKGCHGWALPALLSHQPRANGPCLTPNPSSQPDPRAQGQRGISACVAVAVSGGMKGFGEAQIPAAPEEDIQVLGLETALLAPHGILHFPPSWAQEGQREGL